MKKLLFGMAMIISAFTINAQESSNNTSQKTAAIATSSNAEELAKNLQSRITRVLALDLETSNKIGEVTLDFYQKKFGVENISENKLKAIQNYREEKFKTILGEAKYQSLQEYREKVKQQAPAKKAEGKVSVDNILIQD